LEKSNQQDTEYLKNKTKEIKGMKKNESLFNFLKEIVHTAAFKRVLKM
jgi:hypothetical protein